MAFFQNSVINKYISSLDKQKVSSAYANFRAHFHNATIQENIRGSKEEQYQGEFLIDLFVNVLGYTKNPTPDFNLTTEYKNVKDSKKADGAIIINEIVKAVIELKGTNTTDLNKIEVQAFGYKNNQPECEYVITSNFEKLRFYVDNAIEYLEFNLFTLTEKEFELLYICLSYDSIAKGLPKQIKDESVSQEALITKKLYNDYSVFKSELYHSLVKLNPQYEPLELFKKSQKLLDRFLFIFFAEDRQLLPTNLIFRINKEWQQLREMRIEVSLYDRYKIYFKDLDQGAKVSLPAFSQTASKQKEEFQIYAYNGGLFKTDELLDDIKIEDELLFSHTEKLSNYDFASEVDVNVLGHIFENSLNDVDEIKAQLEGQEIDKTKTKRKKDGVFYTPKYITKYIVDNTVGKLCLEKKEALQLTENDYTINKKRQKKTTQALTDKLNEYRNWLLQLTICDPACGSGAFLNQALDFLITEHRYIDELQAKLFGDALVLSDVEGSILENNLFGVDINEESVEIAKLSLWLRTAQPNRKLNDLNSNIKCGNSLVDDITVASEKAFNWENEFKHVFSKGGFDVIIGNPPYVDIKAIHKNVVDYLVNEYKTANNRINLFSIFIEKACNVLRDFGKFSFIIPSSLLTQESYKQIRQLILSKAKINSIVRLPNESFGGGAGEVKVDTIIITFTLKEIDSSLTKLYIYKGFERISEISNLNCDSYSQIDQSLWSNDENSIIRINIDNNISDLVSKIELQTEELQKCAEFCLGLTPYDKYKGHTPDQINNRVFHSDSKKDETFKKLLAGSDVARYNVEWSGKEWISYGKWLGAPREQRYFKEKRILVKQIIDWSDKRIWAALTEEELYNAQNAFNLIAKSNYYPEYLLILINSKLMSYYHRKKYLEEFKDRFQKILIKDCKSFPIKLIPREKQFLFIDKANLISSLIKDFEEHKKKFSSTLYRKFELETLPKKLENYYSISYKDFINELTKKKIKMSLADEAEWEVYFNTESIKALELKSKIDATDKEIDQMVYKLYDLTEEEIKIVEG